MARALALVADLLFGSRLQASADAAGLELERVADERGVRERLGPAGAAGWEVLVVDLTDPALGGPGLVGALRAEGLLAATRTLGFYAHVDTDTRAAAEQAGFDLVVPRSRMAREGAALIERLAG